MSCVVCGSVTALFHKCPGCENSLCNRDECSSKCPGCKAVQGCRKCFLKGLREDSADQDYDLLAVRDWGNSYCGRQECGQEILLSVEEERSGLSQCQCGKKISGFLIECRICGDNVCEECLKYEICHL
jgi:hypothetical protein